MKNIITKIKNNYYVSINDSNVTDFWTNKICRWIASCLVVLIYPTPITPNTISIISLVLTICGIYQISYYNFEYASILIFLSFIMDCVDGQLARERNTITVFGKYFDLILDNIKEIILFMYFIFYFSTNDYFLVSFFALFIIIFSNMFDWIRKTLIMVVKEKKEKKMNLFSKYGIVFWSGPIRNFIIVFCLLIKKPEYIIIYTISIGLYSTIKKANIIYNLTKSTSKTT